MKNQYEANEAGDDDDLRDINEIERRNLNSLLLIDFKMVNLFLIKKGKKLFDHIHELKKNFSDMIVIRLKKAYWLNSVMLKPSPPSTAMLQ